jgi:hypothetical protein
MEITEIVKHALLITVFVFVMMLLVDFTNAASKERVSHLVRGGPWRQYGLASFLGATPGCLGAFMNVSLYVHGMIGFGAVVGGMIATSGDEALPGSVTGSSPKQDSWPASRASSPTVRNVLWRLNRTTSLPVHFG